MTDSGRQYPNLTTCKVVLQSTTSSLKPPVRLPQECLDVAENTVIPAPYDFALGTLRCCVILLRDSLTLFRVGPCCGLAAALKDVLILVCVLRV